VVGWQYINLPVALVEEWANATVANPGLIFFNEDMTGKFSIASTEWHVEDYSPRLLVWYTD